MHTQAPQHRSWSLDGRLRACVAATLLLAATFVLLSTAPEASAQAACPNPNPVVDENECHTGTAGWETNDDSPNLGGFPTQQSTNKGTDVTLKIARNAPTFPATTANIAVYRMGYYGGIGARLVHSKTGVTINNDFTCKAMDANTGKVDCANWQNTYTIPGSAFPASGIYLAKVTASSGEQTHILFTIRDDLRNPQSQVYFVLPTADYNAYNTFGGKSLYFGTQGGNTASGTSRAVKVSFNRPHSQVGRSKDWLFGPDYNTLYWLEEQGYDVSYSEDVDLHRNPGRVLQHDAVVIPGHSEYWSAEMYHGVKAARDAGVNVASFSANTAYWKVRYEDNDQTMVCYKTVEGGGSNGNPQISDNDWGPDGVKGTADDALGLDQKAGTPDDKPENSTTTWRDNGAPFGDPNAPVGGRVGPNEPENSLWGNMYFGDNDAVDFPLTVPAGNANDEFATDRIWRNTGISTNSPTNMGTEIVGWEWDAVPTQAQYLAFQPAGVKRVSATNVQVQSDNSWLQDEGRARTTNPPPGQPGTVNAVKYTAPSGALVFAGGSNQWALGLYDDSDSRIQQATYNIFSDMGIQPDTPVGVTLDPGGSNKAPVASFTVAPNPTKTKTAVKFDASASKDSNGTIAKYEWDLDGDGSFETNTGTNPVTSKTYAAEGTYTVRLRVTDNGGATDLQVKTLTVIDNQPPTAAFTLNPNPAIVGQSVTANGSTSSDPDGTIAKYEWDFDGNGTYEVNSGASATTSTSFAAVGTVTVGLKVTDNGGKTSTTTLPVTVNNGGISNYGDAVLDTSGLVSFWRMGETSGTVFADSKGTSPATVIGEPQLGVQGGPPGDTNAAARFDGIDDNAQASLNLSGTDKVTVEMWGNFTFANNDKLAMEFTPSYHDNAGGFLIDPNAPQLGGKFAVGIGRGTSRNTAFFDRPAAGWHHYAFVLDASAPAAGQITPYIDGKAVTFTKENSGTGAGNFANSTLYLMSRAGNANFGQGDLDEVAIYNRTLTASEIAEHAASYGTNRRPVGSFTATPNPVQPGKEVKFDASGSTDPDGSIVKYEWDLDGNGSFETNTGTTATAAKTYAAEGDVSVKLRVTDNLTGTDIETKTVKVIMNQTPTASFTANPNPAVLGQTTSFDASASKDAEGAVAKYEWDLDGDGIYETDTGTKATVTRQYTTTGTRSVSLKVTDGGGLAATSALSVSVFENGVSSYGDTVQDTSGLVGYWRLGESSGSTFANSKAGGNPATATGGPTLGVPGAVLGDPNTAARFDGVDDAASTQLDLSGTNKATVEFWLKWNAYANNDKLAMEFTDNFNDNNGGFIVDPNAPQLTGSFGVGMGSNANRNNAFFTRPSAGTWHHYAIVFDTTAAADQQVIPYVDGKAVSYTKAGVSAKAGNFANAKLNFMSRAGSSLFGAGDLDEVAVYSRALDAGTIAEHYASYGTNRRPVAKVTATPNPVPTGDKATLSADGTTDPDGSIAKYEWDLDGNGTFETDTGTTPTASQTYTTAGIVNVKVRAYDNQNGTDTESVALAVGNSSPTASFTATPNPVITGKDLTLDASASTDDVGITKYEWDLDGDGIYEKDNGTAQTLTTTYATGGSKTIGLRVSDAQGSTGTTTKAVTVTAANQPPVAAFAISPDPAEIGQTVTFNAAASSDVDGPIAKYEWDLDGNGSYETDTGSTPTTSRSFDSAGSFPIGLKVTDGTGETGTITQPAHVNASSANNYKDKILATSGLLNYWRMGDTSGTTFADSKGTSTATIAGGPVFGAVGGLIGDPDTAVSFDGTDDAATAPVDLSGTSKATIEFWLKWDGFVNDDDLAFELTPNVNGNQGGFLVDPNAPQAGGKFGVAIGTGATRNTAFFTRPSAGDWHHYALVLDSSAPAASQITPYVDGQPVTYTKGNSGTGAGNFAKANLYFMSRAAASLFGSGDLDEVSLFGRALSAAEITQHYQSVVNAPPAPSFTATPAAVDANQDVALDAAASKDPDGTIVKYEWDLDGNGTYEVDGGATTTHTVKFATAGTKTIGLRVTDNGGQTATTTRDVVVTPEGQPPTASFTVAPNPAQAGETVSFNGSGSTDPEGALVRYEWDLDGNGSYETDTGASSSASRAYTEAGTVKVGLRVTDAAGESGTTTRDLDVNKASDDYAGKVLGTSGLLNYWRMGDTAGTVFADAKGTSPALISGGPSFGAPGSVAGDVDTSASFDGTDDAASAALNLSGTNKVTLEFWLKWDAYANDDDLAMEFTPNFNNNAGGILVDPNSTSGARFGVGIGVGASRNTAYFTRPSAGAWHHYAFVLDTSAPAATQVVPYVDGQPIAYAKPNTGTGAGNFANSTLYFMSRGGASLFGSGDLDEVAVYGRTLSPAEILDHYKAAANNPPTASFTAPASANVNQSVALDASGSKDDEGAIAKYEWDLDGNGTYEVDGGTTATRSTSYATVGVKTINLRVTDSKGATATATQTVNVQSPPTASFTATPSTVASGGNVSYNASASKDADGTITKYEWDFDGNGTFDVTSATATITRQMTKAGAMNVKLRVTDNGGATGEATKVVNVTNKAPTSAFTIAPNPALLNETVTFTSTSTDSDGTIAKHEWDLDGNGTYETNTGATPSATKAFSVATNVNIGLRVTDNLNATATSAKALAVNSKYANGILSTAGLKGYWRLADTNQTAADSSTSNNPGTITNGPVSVAGLIGGETNNARDFDGTNDFINLSPTPFGTPTTFSAEAWVKTGSKKSNGNYHYVVSNTDSDFNNGFTLAIDSNNRATFVVARFVIIITQRGQATSSLALNPNTTYHIAGTYDGSTVRIYVNGVLSGSASYSNGVSWDAQRDLKIGGKVASASQASNYFDGVIDEPALYTSALPAATVAAHYNAGKP